MKKRIFAFITLIAVLFTLSSCNLPFVNDLIESDYSLGKTNNTAVTISSAMEEFLAKKKKDQCTLYEIEMFLNSDGNGNLKMYYTSVLPEDAAYSDIYVAEVDSKTGHVSRFGKADYAKDGIEPYQAVKQGYPLNAVSLPIDSNKAITLGVKAFSGDQDFYYDFIQIVLAKNETVERYSIQFISMLNDKVYYCDVDAVNGTVLRSSVGALEDREI